MCPSLTHMRCWMHATAAGIGQHYFFNWGGGETTTNYLSTKCRRVECYRLFMQGSAATLYRYYISMQNRSMLCRYSIHTRIHLMICMPCSVHAALVPCLLICMLTCHRTYPSLSSLNTTTNQEMNNGKDKPETKKKNDDEQITMHKNTKMTKDDDGRRQKSDFQIRKTPNAYLIPTIE